jgi:predicted DNA-binding WGR domain protein
MEQSSSEQGLEAGAIQLSADSLHFGFGRIGENQKRQMKLFEQNASRHEKVLFGREGKI